MCEGETALCRNKESEPWDGRDQTFLFQMQGNHSEERIECPNTLNVVICTNTRRHRDGSVGIATRYGMDGQGIESRLRREFSHTLNLLHSGYRVIPGDKAAMEWR
jgi:hypothetical protein